MLTVASLAVFFTGPAQTYGISVFVQPMTEDLGLSQSLFSTLYSAGTLFSAISLTFAGRIIDRVGSRKVMSFASIVFGLALLILSMVNSVLALLIGFALLRASGQGVLSLGARTLVPMWFHSRAGRAFAFLSIAAMASSAVIPLYGNFLVDSFGWRDAFRINAFVIWIVVLPMVAFIVRDRPEDIGQHPDGIPPDPDSDKPSASQIGLSLQQAMRTFTFWALLMASLVPSLVVTGLAFNQISILTERELPGSLAASTFALEAVVAFPVTLLAGWLSDRFPVKWVMFTGQVLLLGAMGVLIMAETVPMMMLYAALRGASGGMWMVGADTAWPGYFGRKHLGNIRGIGFSVGIAGAALGPLPFGISYDLLGSYNSAILGLMILPLIAAIGVTRCKPEIPTS